MSVTPVYGRVMPIEPRRYVSTLTDEARAEIVPLVEKLAEAEAEVLAAERRADEVRAERDRALRKHYADGVEVRDLVTISGLSPKNGRNRLHVIVRGARLPRP